MTILAMVILAAGGWCYGASGSNDLNLVVGATSVLEGIDPDSTPTVRIISGTHPFYVDNGGPGKLIILGAERGEGQLTVSRNRILTSYRITVASLTDPNNPLAPGKTPPPMGEPHFTTDGRAADASRGPGDATAAGTPANAPPASAATYRVAGAAPAASGPPAAAAGEPLPPAAPGQSVAPYAARPNSYAANPPAVFRRGRSLDVPGRRPLPAGAIALMSGTSAVYDFPSMIARVSVSDTQVADVQVVDPHQLILVGRAPGFTSLIIWDEQNNYLEREVRIEKTGEQQIVLNVVVAEVNRTKMENVGIDFTDALTKYGLSFASLPGFVAAPYSSAMQINGYQGFLPPGGNYYPLPVSNSITYAIGGQNANNNANAFFQFLEDHQLGKVLAEPNLLATSGQEAKFLDGGEIPIIVSQALNTSIVFKQYGTSVSFLPTVVGQDDIELMVRPEVSSPDYTHQVVLNGYSVPAFITRRAETLVRLHGNQTLLIAGLRQEQTISEVKKVPYMGDLPYLGGLFRATSYTHNKTELVMSVTPRLVRPIPPGGQLRLPTDGNPILTPESVRTGSLPEPDASRPRF